MNDFSSPSDSPNDDQHKHEHVHTFAVPLDAVMRQHDRGQQAAEMWTLRMLNFIDSLSVDQVIVLRRILNMDSDSAWNMYWDGQLAAILRLVHHVDEFTGEPLLPGSDGPGIEDIQRTEPRD